MLLLILAVLWGIVLIPPALRARSERRRIRSVDVFRRHLQRLSAPVAAAGAATRPPGAARPAGAARSHVAVAASPVVALLVPARRGEDTAPAASPPTAPAAAAPPGRRYASRADLLRRRRRVLAGLVAATVVAFAAGVASGLEAFFVLDVALAGVLAGYVAALRRLRRLALERAAKVRYLPVAGSGGRAPAAEPVERVGAPGAVAAAGAVATGQPLAAPLRRSASR